MKDTYLKPFLIKSLLPFFEFISYSIYVSSHKTVVVLREHIHSFPTRTLNIVRKGNHCSFSCILSQPVGLSYLYSWRLLSFFLSTDIAPEQ